VYNGQRLEAQDISSFQQEEMDMGSLRCNHATKQHTQESCCPVLISGACYGVIAAVRFPAIQYAKNTCSDPLLLHKQSARPLDHIMQGICCQCIHIIMMAM
jgi:hypothetical protein